MPNVSEILNDALRLDESERASLAQEILASLDGENEVDPAEAERLWGEEAQRRLSDYRAKGAHSVPAGVVAERVKPLLP